MSIKKFQTKTFKRKSAKERLRLVNDAMAQAQIDMIGATSRVQSAVLAHDEDQRRSANRELVSLSIFVDELKFMHRQILSEQRSGSWAAQAKARRLKDKKATGNLDGDPVISPPHG